MRALPILGKGLQEPSFGQVSIYLVAEQDESLKQNPGQQ